MGFSRSIAAFLCSAGLIVIAALLAFSVSPVYAVGGMIGEALGPWARLGTHLVLGLLLASLTGGVIAGLCWLRDRFAPDDDVQTKRRQWRGH